MEQCCAMVKGRPCAVGADRFKKVQGLWYCHLHDPEGENQANLRLKGSRRAIDLPKATEGDQTRQMATNEGWMEHELLAFVWSELRAMGHKVRYGPSRATANRAALIVTNADGEQIRTIETKNANIRAHDAPIDFILTESEAKDYVVLAVRRGSMTFDWSARIKPIDLPASRH